MEEEKNTFEKNIEQRFEDLMDQVIELRNLVEVYMEQEDLSPEFEDTYKCIEWVAGNYPFAALHEEE